MVEVDNDDAMAVLEALWRVYEHGREDLSNELTADRKRQHDSPDVTFREDKFPAPPAEW